MSVPEPPVVIDTPRLAIRVLAPDEAPRLQAVLEAAPDHFQALSGRPRPAPDSARQELAASAAQPGRAAAVVTLRETGEDVGALAWWEGNPSPDRALLGMVLVVPTHRKQGIAREALAGLEGWLAGRGMHALRTAFARRRYAVHPVVKALGFREMSIAEHTKLGLAGAGMSLWEKGIG